MAQNTGKNNKAKSFFDPKSYGLAGKGVSS